jgi:hypothetical protein
MNVLFMFEIKIYFGHYAEKPETFLIAKNSLNAGSLTGEEFDDWGEVQSAIGWFHISSFKHNLQNYFNFPQN